jgi:formate/nitrite transporter FocA (FNT family)
VYGVDGLKVGGGCGGGRSGNCACACSIARLKKTIHPATKNFASAVRSNLVVCIAVSFEPM